MTQNLPSTERKPLTLRERIANASPEFKKALPGHIPVEKFVRTVQTAVSMSHDIEAACGQLRLQQEAEDAATPPVEA